MANTPIAERVRRTRERQRMAGLRPVQLWVPDTTSPEFVHEADRQAKLVAEWDRTPEGREEVEFWQSIAAWDDEAG